MGPIAHSLALLAAAGLSPALALAWLVRPGLRPHFGERLGRLPADLEASLGSAAPPIYVHAASVGEAKAAARLIDRLEAAGHAVVATTSTVGGRDVLRNDRPHGDAHLFPLDHPWTVERLLRRVQPALSVLIETELWPSWIAGCARHGVPVVVASGRLSDRSFPRYRKVRRLLRPTLERVEAVGARTELDAERFVELGVPEARVAVTGDLKLDPPADRPALSIDLIRALADCPVVIGGSTHEGEEVALLQAMTAAEKAGHGFVLVLAPRHVHEERGHVRAVAALRIEVGLDPPGPGPREELEARLGPEEEVVDLLGELQPAGLGDARSVLLVGLVLARVEVLEVGLEALAGQDARVPQNPAQVVGPSPSLLGEEELPLTEEEVDHHLVAAAHGQAPGVEVLREVAEDLVQGHGAHVAAEAHVPAP